MDGGGFGGGSSLFFWGRRRETEVDEVEMGTVLQTTIQTQKPKHVASSTGWGGGRMAQEIPPILLWSLTYTSHLMRSLIGCLKWLFHEEPPAPGLFDHR